MPSSRRKSRAPRVYTFQQLLNRVLRLDPALLSTAQATGWLVHPYFMTQLTDREAAKLKSFMKQHRIAKAPPERAVMDLLPALVGPLISKLERNGAAYRLSTPSGSHHVYVDARFFLTLQARHPRAALYLDKEDPEGNPLIFSERAPVAVLPLIKKA